MLSAPLRATANETRRPAERRAKDNADAERSVNAGESRNTQMKLCGA